MTRLKSRRWQITLAVVILALVIVTLLAIRSQTETLAIYRPVGEARAAWESRGMGDYRLSVHEIGVWGIVDTETLVVDGGVVAARSTCQPGLIPVGCMLPSFDGAAFTVPGLLDRAARHPASTTVTLESADPYLLVISHDDPAVLDDEWRLTATAVQAGADDDTLPPLLPEAPPAGAPPALVIPDAADLPAALDEAEAAWLESGIERYVLQVAQADDSGMLTLWVRIEGGSVNGFSAHCTPDNGRASCAVPQLTLAEYRVPDHYGTGLFATARAAAESPPGAEPPVALHPDRHYPAIIRTETATITVLSLQPLED